MRKTIIGTLSILLLVFTGILNYAVAQQNNLKDTKVKIFRDSNFQILDNKDSLKANYYSIITYKGENVYGAVRDFYKSGMPLAVGYYNGNNIGQGYENGKFTRYHENGKIFQTSNYVNGLLDGVYIEYYPSGLKKACVSYTMGKRYGCEYSWDENGKASVYNQNYANCPCAKIENNPQNPPSNNISATISSYPNEDIPSVSYEFSDDIYKNYNVKEGGIIFWTDCKDCNWSIKGDNATHPITSSQTSKPTYLTRDLLFWAVPAGRDYTFSVINRTGSVFEYRFKVFSKETLIVAIRKRGSF